MLGVETSIEPGGTTNMATIVVGSDGSPSAAEALRWAVREGHERGWSVRVVLAWDYLNQPRLAHSEPFHPDFGEADAKLVLDRYVHDALGDRAGGVEAMTVCDLPVRALLGASAGADLLVLGARGLGGVRGALLGSVSQQCVHHSTVPVAIVRSAPTPAASGVVVAIDGSEGAQRALDWALDEARARKCGISVVTVWHPSPSATWAVPAAWPDMTGLQEAADELIDRALGRADSHGMAPDAIQRRPMCGTVVDAVLEAAQDASLLVVGSRGRGGFAGLLLGSVSQHLAHHAVCPIVVVPPRR
jgi:nucleotide-binding universal stress UspA family protein